MRAESKLKLFFVFVCDNNFWSLDQGQWEKEFPRESMETLRSDQSWCCLSPVIHRGWSDGVGGVGTVGAAARDTGNKVNTAPATRWGDEHPKDDTAITSVLNQLRSQFV